MITAITRFWYGNSTKKKADEESQALRKSAHKSTAISELQKEQAEQSKASTERLIELANGALKLIKEK